MDRSTLVKNGLFSLALLTLLLDIPALHAADGDIVLLRDVQPRTATREPLVADPNPTVVNPRTLSQDPVQHGVPTSNFVSRSMGELDDSDFAGISSGSGLAGSRVEPGQAIDSQLLGNPLSQQTVPNGAPASHQGGATGSIAGQVTRSVEQGLRPLQALGGK